VESPDREVKRRQAAAADAVAPRLLLFSIPQFAGRPRIGAGQGQRPKVRSLLRIILEKGKPVARPGRKARGQPLDVERERLLARLPKGCSTSTHDARITTDRRVKRIPLFLTGPGSLPARQARSARRRANRDDRGQLPGVIVVETPDNQ
jgi:hypothetical protein